MDTEKPLYILNVGLSLDSYGGVANNQRRVMAHMPCSVRIEHVPTILARVEVSRAANAGRFVVAWLVVLWRLLTRRIDVVHLRISQRGSVWRKLLVVPLAWLRRVPVIVHAHGSEFHLFYRSIGRAGRAVVSAMLRRCDGLVVLGEGWKGYYVEQVGLEADRVLVMPNPVEIPAVIPDRAGRRELTIAFLGRVGERKGAFELIEAFAALPGRLRVRARLVIGGDGETERAERLAERIGCADRVELRGWLDAEQTAELLREADIFVLPTRNEGMPLALLEAMSWGVASISTPVGGIPEVLADGRNGLMVEPGEVEQIGDAMRRLIEDEPLRLRLGKAGRVTAEGLDIKVYVERLARLYEQLARRDAVLDVVQEPEEAVAK